MSRDILSIGMRTDDIERARKNMTTLSLGFINLENVSEISWIMEKHEFRMVY